MKFLILAVIFFIFSSLNSDEEVLHYAVSNLTTETSGDIWSSYLPPIPVKGTGYHRFVVTLYHQKEALEKSVLGDSLADREFSSKSFLKQNEENLTPAALRFSQGFFSFLDFFSLKT